MTSTGIVALKNYCVMRIWKVQLTKVLINPYIYMIYIKDILLTFFTRRCLSMIVAEVVKHTWMVGLQAGCYSCFKVLGIVIEIWIKRIVVIASTQFSSCVVLCQDCGTLCRTCFSITIQ